MMKLYCDPISTSSRPVMMFAAETGLAIELVHVDLVNGAAATAEYLSVNPNGCVPFLVDGDFALGESTAILKYLAEIAGSPAYPAEPKARARVNAAMDWFYTNFHNAYCRMAIYSNFGLPRGLEALALQGLAACGEEQANRWLKVLDAQMLGGQPYVCGPQITLADYPGAAFVTLGEAVAFDLSAYPNVLAWIDRMKSRLSWDGVYAGFNGMLSALRAQARIPA